MCATFPYNPPALLLSSVLPGHDGDRVAHAGDSLIRGFAACQCSYTAAQDSDFRLPEVPVFMVMNRRQDSAGSSLPAGAVPAENLFAIDQKTVNFSVDSL